MEILLWQVRDEKGYTLERLEQKSGISKSTLQRIETGETSPTMEAMEKIAKAMNVRIIDLFESEYK